MAIATCFPWGSKNRQHLHGLCPVLLDQDPAAGQLYPHRTAGHGDQDGLHRAVERDLQERHRCGSGRRYLHTQSVAGTIFASFFWMVLEK